ncbi:MAG: hypothetical protein ACTHZI_09095 [Luteimonas sp.]
MTNQVSPIRVALIGLNPGIHWGATAHVPALASLPDDYELVGVANTSLASAERAAKAFGLKHAFPNAQRRWWSRRRWTWWW